MCQQLHPNSFIVRLVKEIKKQINHQPKLVGEIYFKNFLPPRLCHLNGQHGTQKAVIHNGIGRTLMFIVKRYEQKSVENKSVNKLLDAVFDRPPTHQYIAAVLIETAKAVINNFQLDTAGGIITMTEPDNEDFGSKKIFFFLLNAVLDLFINMLVGNKKYEVEFGKKEEEWINFVRLAAEQKNNSSRLH